jgi:hypothetical protein
VVPGGGGATPDPHGGGLTRDHQAPGRRRDLDFRDVAPTDEGRIVARNPETCEDCRMAAAAKDPDRPVEGSLCLEGRSTFPSVGAE